MFVCEYLDDYFFFIALVAFLFKSDPLTTTYNVVVTGMEAVLPPFIGIGVSYARISMCLHGYQSTRLIQLVEGTEAARVYAQVSYANGRVLIDPSILDYPCKLVVDSCVIYDRATFQHSKENIEAMVLRDVKIENWSKFMADSHIVVAGNSVSHHLGWG